MCANDISLKKDLNDKVYILNDYKLLDPAAASQEIEAVLDNYEAKIRIEMVVGVGIPVVEVYTCNPRELLFEFHGNSEVLLAKPSGVNPVCYRITVHFLDLGTSRKTQLIRASKLQQNRFIFFNDDTTYPSIIIEMSDNN